ncbi:hypothetical protein [Egbenema bharatensis]|uniref:hypothetical protein n=1 Tax=Egbenema bharatensis TaxID=3463334 RepID=UPI003A85DA89
MASRAQQEEYLASIAQAFDVGDFDYLPPDQMQSLNALIADAWKAFEQGGDAEAQISKIQQALGRK